MTRGIAALTGGTGFIGRVCAASLVASGWQVRRLVRRDPAHPVLSHTPTETVLGDLDDEAALIRLVRGADAVVHAAGAIRGRNDAAFLAVNRDGTGRLASVTAREAPAARFVLLSSQAARCPELSPYAASKLAGEAAMRAALGAQNSWVILRPGIVYGPWDEATRSLLRLANLPLVPVPAAPEPRLTMIHVSDVAAAIVAFCANGPSGALHELCDAASDGHAWRSLVACASGRPAPRFVTVPDSVLLAAGGAADFWSKLAGTPSIFGRGKAREILHRDWRPDATLGVPPTFWRAETALAAGLGALIPTCFDGDSCSARGLCPLDPRWGVTPQTPANHGGGTRVAS